MMRRMRRQAAVIGLVVVLWGLLPTATTALDPTESATIAVRAQYGLSTDVGLVRRLQGSEPSGLAGIPLTAEEEADMSRRLQVQENLGEIKAYGRSIGPSFGGIYIDQRAGGEVVVSFVGTVDPHRAIVEGLAPVHAKLRLRSVEFSIVELDGVNDRISLDAVADAPLARHVRSVETDVVANRVRVGLDTRDPAVAAAIREKYDSKAIETFFVPAEVAPDVCNSEFDCGPPWRGGIALNNVCTSNFVARANTVYFLLTAGHCFVLNAEIRHNGRLIGRMTLEKYNDNSPADTARITMDAAQRTNLIYLNAAVQRAITSREARDADTTGDSVCQNGIASDFNCGVITSVNFFQHYGDGTDLPRQRKATYVRAGGDSGASVFYGNRAKGVHSGPASDGSGNAVYSHVWELETQLGLVVYTG
jgi:hypothetical protein